MLLSLRFIAHIHRSFLFEDYITTETITYKTFTKVRETLLSKNGVANKNVVHRWECITNIYNYYAIIKSSFCTVHRFYNKVSFILIHFKIIKLELFTSLKISFLFSCPKCHQIYVIDWSRYKPRYWSYTFEIEKLCVVTWPRHWSKRCDHYFWHKGDMIHYHASFFLLCLGCFTIWILQKWVKYLFYVNMFSCLQCTSTCFE